jgi:hypothetical protein
MTGLNLENAKWLIATLAIPVTLAFVAHNYQQSQAERQISDARLRLYTELLSKREEADTAVRRGIFDKVLERYLTPGDQGLQAKLVGLEALASNFHDSLDLSPLFWQIYREIQRAPKRKRTELTHQLIRIADLVKDRQIAALEFGTGKRGPASQEGKLSLDELTNEDGVPDIDAEFSFPDSDPLPLPCPWYKIPCPSPSGRTLTTRHLKLWITAYDAEKHRVYAAVQAPAKLNEKDQHWGFWIDMFDFPW